tara:strand:- start:233 stop:463 length:231 start_codon:yes stop_codon:yes gene_type:complete
MNLLDYRNAIQARIDYTIGDSKALQGTIYQQWCESVDLDKAAKLVQKLAALLFSGDPSLAELDAYINARLMQKAKT